MNRAEGLEHAKYLWEVSGHLPLPQKLALCKELSYYDMFSRSQLASIARMDPKTLKKHGIRSNARGGRFNPEAITTLQILEEQFRLEKMVSKHLVDVCLGTGCSANAIADIIGVHHGKVYRLL